MAYPPAGEEIIIDIPSELPPADSLECCIYRVPKLLRKVNEEAYTPKLISIGPFHYNREELEGMKMHKLRYFKNFLDRTGKSQEDLRKIIEDDEKKIRLCYSEECSLDSRDFLKMILLDAVFIIELFLKVRDQKEREDEERKVRDQKKREDEERKVRDQKKREDEERKVEEEDYILRKKWLANGIYYDLLLLENQLPFFVLEKLYMFAFHDSSSCNDREEGKGVTEHKFKLQDEDTPFVKLFRIYFTYYDDQKRKSIGEKVTKEPIGEEVKHFTDMLRYLFCPSHMEKVWKSEMVDNWSGKEGCQDSCKKNKKRNFGTQFCATKLDDAGLKFKVKDDTCLLDIKLPGCFGRFPCFVWSCVTACLPCFISLICFPSLESLFGCFGYPMHIFKFPQLVIDCNTEAIFRNLMALEQCHYPSKTYICSYVLLLDRLIDTEKDVNLLVDKKVITHQLGSNGDVAILINKLGDRIVVNTECYYFDHIAQKLNAHYEFPLNHFLATLKREYFTNVFRGTTTIIGLIVLGFTTWNTIRPYVLKT
jgi:hypothetical protein